jgi:hypothetical protein
MFGPMEKNSMWALIFELWKNQRSGYIFPPFPPTTKRKTRKEIKWH